MTEKGQSSQGYIIRILQHFETKLRNITNFVMLFQAVMNFLPRLGHTKLHKLTFRLKGREIQLSLNITIFNHV
jgi:hypothetical protein